MQKQHNKLKNNITNNANKHKKQNTSKTKTKKSKPSLKKSFDITLKHH